MNKEKFTHKVAEIKKSLTTQKAKEVLTQIAIWGGLGVELAGFWIILGLLPATTTAAVATGLFIGGSLITGVGSFVNDVRSEKRRNLHHMQHHQNEKQLIASPHSMK